MVVQFLGEVAQVTPGWNLARKAEGTRAVRVIHVRDLPEAGGVVSVPELEHIAVPEAAARCLAHGGDVVLTARGAQLRAAQVPELSEDVIASSNLLVISPKPVLRPEVLAAFLSSALGRAALTALSSSTTGLVNLTARAVERIRIPVPPLDAQARIAALFQATHDAHREALRAADCRLELGRALLASAFVEPMRSSA